MKVSKVFNYIFATIGFLCVASLCTLLAIYFIIPKKNRVYFFTTTGAFVKQCIRDTSISRRPQEPSTFEKLRTHLILAYKKGTIQSTDTLFSENICGFTVTFPSYSMIHFLFKEIFVQRSYDFKAKTNTPFIIDAGSNIGMSILYFKMIYPHAKIIGFEPDDATFDILEKNINNNKLTDVKLYKKALSNKQGFISFFYDKNTPGGLGASIVSHGPCEKKVESDTLSHFITQPVDLLKIDIEAGLCPN